MQKIILILSISLIANFSFAQQEFGTHFLNGTWQGNMTNPSMLPTNKVTISLPGFYTNLGISNITYNDIFDSNGAADINNVISKLEASNYFKSNLALQTFGIGIRSKRFFFSFNHEIRSNNSITYPKELLQLAWQGNAQFIGKQISFAPTFQFSTWHQIGIGIGFQINDKITIGAKIKKLSGIIDVSSSDDSFLHLTTSGDIYQLLLDANYTVQTSGGLDFNDFTDFSFSPTGIDIGSINQLFNQNSGVALDLGATISLGKLSLSASALDLGSIHWKKNAKQYSIQGSYEFEGITYTQNIFEDSTQFTSIVDTIQTIFQPTTENNSYRTALPRQFYLSGNYSLTENLKVGALFYVENNINDLYPAFTLAANYSLSSLLKVGAAYTMKKGSLDNLGLNAVIKLGPIQLVAATDNIFSAFSPKDHNHANVRLGLNLVFGKVKEAKDGTTPMNFY